MSAQQRITVMDITTELANLRNQQATKLCNLLAAHRIQERELLDRLYNAASDIGFEDAVETNSEATAPVVKDAPPTEFVTQDRTTPIPVATPATFVPSSSIPHDIDRCTLFVGDRVRILTKGSNNINGDAAHVLGIHATRKNWIEIKIEHNSVVTHRLGTNLQVIQ